MKKYFIGFIVGVVLTFPFYSFASNDLIGKVIQGTFPLVINGEKAEKDVIVVDGTSYLPVRAAGEMFGYKVDFNNQTVYLNNNENVGDTMGLSYQEWVELRSSTTQRYPFNSTTLELYWVNKMETEYLLLDNEVYLPLELFKKYVRYKEPDLTFNFPERDPVTLNHERVNRERPYTPGIDSFQYASTAYIKASAIGVSTEIKDGTLWIELQ